MIISVKKKHIKNGVVGSCKNCPVALAIKEQVKSKQVVVRSYIIINDSIMGMSRSVCRFISRFDARKPVKPFNFRLSV